MKKNALLFAVLLVLVVATYVFQEKRIEKNYEEALTKDHLILNEINHLKLPHLEADKKDGQWWEGKVLLSHNGMKQIEKKLSEIKKIKTIEGDWKSYFPNPFIFEINHEVWTIGDLSLDKQSFYVAQGDKIYLAVMEGESVQLTRDATEIASIKVNELVSSLSKSKLELTEKQLFRFYPKIPLGKAVLDIDGNLPFELDFLENKTLPGPLSGISVHRDIRGKFFSLLTQVTLREEVPYSEKLKHKKLGTLKLQNEHEDLTWELWLRAKDSADALVIDSSGKRAFLMVGGTLKLFFVQIQDYWDKKVIPSTKFSSFTELPVTFIQGAQKADILVFNREPLSFESKTYKVQTEKMQELFGFIFNLGVRDQGERVSQLQKSETKQLLSEEHLRMEVMGQELIFWRKSQELIVANLTQGYKVHFLAPSENFLGTFEDVLK